MRVADIKKTVREVPDFPKPGILFYDLSTLFRNARAFASTMDRMAERYRGEKLDAIAGIEARGFVVAGALADRLGVGLVLLRKPGKLPWETEGVDFTLEYGTARLEVHRDAVLGEQRVLVVDDLLATGGTASASGELLAGLGAKVEGYAFVAELTFLRGRERLGNASVFSLLQFDR